MKKLLCQTGILCSLVALTACGGSKILKEPAPMVAMQPLVVASDQKIAVALDWVIFRDGPGTWARGADWDEYLLRVWNNTDQPLEVTRLLVIDSLNAPAEAQSDRKLLVKSSKATARRYKESGITVQAGTGRGTLGVAAATAGGAAIGAAAGAGTAFVGAAGGAAVVGGLVLAPALAVGGVMRGVNQSKVGKQIRLRRTEFPVELAASEERSLVVFFPIAPAPKAVELTYADLTGEHTLKIDTSEVLDGLHIEAEIE